jgi:hypothetical protein
MDGVEIQATMKRPRKFRRWSSVRGPFAASIRDRAISCPPVLTGTRRTFAGVFVALAPGWRLRIVEQD